MFVTAVILAIVLAPVLIFLGTAKVIRHPMMVAKARHLGFSERGFQLVGAIELVGIAGLLTGLFWPPLGVAAAAGLVLFLVGGAIAHARVKDTVTAMIPAVVCAALSASTLVLLAAA